MTEAPGFPKLVVFERYGQREERGKGITPRRGQVTTEHDPASKEHFHRAFMRPSRTTEDENADSPLKGVQGMSRLV